MAASSMRKWIITVTVISAAVMELIDTSIVNVALTEMSGNLGATLEDTAWVVTAYAIANVIIIPMTSFLAARLGRRVYYIGSILLFTLASFLCGHATGIWELVAFRFLQGIGGGALLSTSQAILFEAFTPEERGLASGIFGLGIVVGPTLGPTLGGYIVDNFSWPWIFYVNIPVGIAATALSLAYVEEPAEVRRADHIDWVGIGLLIVGVGSLQTVLERGEAEDWFSSPWITLLAVVAGFCLPIFVWWEVTVPNPVVDLRVLKSRTLAFAALLTFVLGFGLFSSVFMVPVFAQRLLGFTAMQTGLLLLPGALVAAFLLPMIGRSIQKGVPPQPFVMAGFTFTMIFSFLMSRSSLDSGESSFFWPLILRGIGIACLTVPLTVLAVADLRGRDIPQGSALNNMMRQLGGSFGIAAVNVYISQRQAIHRTNLLSHLNLFEPATQERIAGLTRAFVSRGVSPGQAEQQAYAALEFTVRKQTMLLSYLDAFRAIAFITFLCIPLVLVIRRKSSAPVKVSLSDH